MYAVTKGENTVQKMKMRGDPFSPGSVYAIS